MKAEDLPPNKSMRLLEDPRPVNLRNLEGYQAVVRSTIVNYCAVTGHDITMRYLYAGADLHAAVHDHRYTSTPFTEFWVDSSLKVTS